MSRPTRTLAVLALFLAGCGTGRDVTERSLREARIRWNRANVRDYDLEWSSSGLRAGHYRVTVRGGRVQQVRTVTPDGREIEAHPGDPSFYAVDGLFQTIEDELEQAHSDRPFGRPPGAKALLKFDPDPDLGYPRKYRRDIVGAPQGLAIDVLKLDLKTSEGG